MRALLAIERFAQRVWNAFALRARNAYWRAHFASAPGLVVGGPIRVKHPENVHAGARVQLSEQVYLNARAPIYLGDDVRLSAFVRVNTGAIDLDAPLASREAHTSAPVRIERGAWLATGVTVNAGVTIHEGAVVGAGAVVANDLPAYTLCVGMPAKPVRDLPRPPGA